MQLTAVKKSLSDVKTLGSHIVFAKGIGHAMRDLGKDLMDNSEKANLSQVKALCSLDDVIRGHKGDRCSICYSVLTCTECMSNEQNSCNYLK